MSDHKCRVPGCTENFQTQAGCELHEQLYHGYTGIAFMSGSVAMIETLSGLYSASIPITQQIAFLQDEIFIQETLNLNHSS